MCVILIGRFAVRVLVVRMRMVNQRMANHKRVHHVLLCQARGVTRHTIDIVLLYLNQKDSLLVYFHRNIQVS